MADGPIHLILSEGGSAYLDLADAFRSAYGQHREVKVWQLSDLSEDQMREMSRDNRLMVPVGIKATKFVADNHDGQASVLSLMVPRTAFEQIQWPARLSRRSISAVFIDQPVARSLSLIDAAFPDRNRVGIVISEDNTSLLKTLSLEAARRRLKLNVETVEQDADVGPALRKVLERSDVLLLLPDRIAINTGNVQNVLLTTYRYRVPVVGFSKGLAKAGAVAVVYSSPQQIGQQGAQIAARWSPESGVLAAPQYPTAFLVDFNTYVARSLDLVLSDENEIRHRMGAQNE